MQRKNSLNLNLLMLLFFQLVANNSFSTTNPGNGTRFINKPVSVQQSQNHDPDTQFRSLLNTGNEYSWRLISTELGLNGSTHSRYQQQFKGVQVKNALLILHRNFQGDLFVTGSFIDVVNFDDRNIIAFQKFTLLPEIKKLLRNATINSENPELWWIWNDESKKFEKTYQVTFFPSESLMQYSLQLNAISGNVISIHNLACFINTPGIAHTSYHGQCGITTFHQHGAFQLKSTNRGKGIETLNLNNQLNYSSISEFYDDDNLWQQLVPGNEKNATDAHFCAEQYYDFLINDFGRNSIDNNGQKLVSYLNYGNGLLNAFWNGSAVVYGSGNLTTGPVTTLDISGHEFTHGLIQKTANLNYQGEPGTINEAMADIFGTALEFYALPQQADWQVGERTGQVFRSLQYPKQFNQPDTYHGVNWYFGSGDNGGIHINSGFINKWFHLLSEGGQGVNDKGWNYSVSGIGIDHATRITYQTLIAYLLPASGFKDLMFYSIQSASDLFGTCSPEYLAVIDAWKAVGLRDITSEPLLLETFGNTAVCDGDSLELFTEGVPGSTFSWNKDGVIVQSGIASNYFARTGGIYSVTELRCSIQYFSNSISIQTQPLPLVSTGSHRVCEGDTVYLTGFPAGGFFSVPNPYSGPGTTYQYQFTDTSGCRSSAMGTIYRLESPVVKIENEIRSFPVNGYAVKLVGNAPGHFYGLGVEDGYFFPGVAGIGGPYTVYLTFTNLNGCTASDSVDFFIEKPCNRDVQMLEILSSEDIMQGVTVVNCSVPVSPDDFTIQWRVYGEHQFLGGMTDPTVSITMLNDEVLVEVILVNTCKESTIIQKHLKSLQSSRPVTGLYPNPASNYLNLDFKNYRNDDPIGIELVDISGRVCLVSTYEQPSFVTWNISELAKGYYLLKITQGSYREFIKVVIN